MSKVQTRFQPKRFIRESVMFFREGMLYVIYSWMKAVTRASRERGPR